MASTLWNNYRYRLNVECLVDTHIREYDISKANISILREKNVLDDATYSMLYVAERMDRQIYIGNLEGSNSEVSKILSQGILEAKQKFFEMNDIQNSDVLEIDNDAIFIMGDRPIKVQQVSPYVNFKFANEYTSFYMVKNIKYFYYYNLINKTEKLDVKGLGSKARVLHENYMLDFLKELFKTAQIQGVTDALNLLSIFHQTYISKLLPIGYYRNLNSRSFFAISNFDQYANYESEYIDPRYLRMMDISYNERILREFNRILSSKYLRKQR